MEIEVKKYTPRGWYVTSLVSEWARSSPTTAPMHREWARSKPVDVFADALTLILRNSHKDTPAWRVAQELAPNDYLRIDWRRVARELGKPDTDDRLGKE